MPTTVPLRLDSQLVNDARTSAALLDRTPTAQVEFWAKLGRVAEAVFTHDSIRTIKKIGRAKDIDGLLSGVDTPEGRQLALDEIRRNGTPTYGTDPKHPGFIIERHPNGTLRIGKFVNRQFVAELTQTPNPATSKPLSSRKGRHVASGSIPAAQGAKKAKKERQKV